jgi:hypothetical protein
MGRKGFSISLEVPRASCGRVLYLSRLNKTCQSFVKSNIFHAIIMCTIPQRQYLEEAESVCAIDTSRLPDQ